MRSESSRIVLVGFRACGKTSLGSRLADRLGRPFVDLDHEIEAYAGQSIAELFAGPGEERFREFESELLEGILARPDFVLAPGGGVVIRERNRSLLTERGFVVYLRVPEVDLLERLKVSGSRPALTDRPLEEEVTELLGVRDPLYLGVADEVVEIPRGETLEMTFERLWRLLGAS